MAKQRSNCLFTNVICAKRVGADPRCCVQVCMWADQGHPLEHEDIVLVSNALLKKTNPSESPITKQSKWVLRWTTRHKHIISHRLVEGRSKLRIMSSNINSVAHMYTVMGGLYKKHGRPKRGQEFDQEAVRFRSLCVLNASLIPVCRSFCALSTSTSVEQTPTASASPSAATCALGPTRHTFRWKGSVVNMLP